MAYSSVWHRYGLGPWRRHAVPLVVWLLAAGAAGRFMAHRSSSCELTGFACPTQRDVAALTEGRLRLVLVELLEAVTEGQPVAVLEDDLVQASLATAAAEASRLRAELAAAEGRIVVESAVQEAEHLAEARRCAVDVEMNRLKELEIAALIETDRVRLEFLRLQMAVLSKLQAQQAVSNLTSREAEAECGAIEKSVQENEKTLAQVRLDLAQARQRQEAFEKNHVVPQKVDQVLEPLRAAITVQERLMEELGIRREMLVLKSPMDGVIHQVWRGPGESVRIGEPVLTVVSPRPFAVVAYAAADQVSLFESGSPVRLQVARNGGDRQSEGSYVVAIGPMAEELPAQLRRNPTVPEWGWPVKIAVPPTLGVLCGEMVGVCRR